MSFAHSKEEDLHRNWQLCLNCCNIWRTEHTRCLKTQSLVKNFPLLFEVAESSTQVKVLEMTSSLRILVLSFIIAKVDALKVTKIQVVKV